MYSIKDKQNDSKPNSRRSKLIWTLGIVVLMVAAIGLLELTDKTHIFHKRKVVSSTIPTDNSAKSSSNKSNAPGTTPKSTPNSQTSDSTTGEKNTVLPNNGSSLLAPSGNFASNHFPSLKNSKDEESVCTTTPGASCTITFTNKDGITKTLAAKQVDKGGTAIWNWDIESAEFVEGSWQIKATASLNGQTKSTSDLQRLEVQP